jgi:hypothetical protein
VNLNVAPDKDDEEPSPSGRNLSSPAATVRGGEPGEETLSDLLCRQHVASKLIDQVRPIVRLATYYRPIDYFDRADKAASSRISAQRGAPRAPKELEHVPISISYERCLNERKDGENTQDISTLARLAAMPKIVRSVLNTHLDRTIFRDWLRITQSSHSVKNVSAHKRGAANRQTGESGCPRLTPFIVCRKDFFSARHALGGANPLVNEGDEGITKAFEMPFGMVPRMQINGRLEPS